MEVVRQKAFGRLGWIIIGMIIFSPLIVNITMQILGFPFMVPELFFIPLYLLYKNHIDGCINYICLSISLVCLFMLFAFSLLIQEFEIAAIVSTFRGYLYMFISFSFFYNRKIKDLDWLMFLSMGSLLGWIIVSIYNYFLLSDSLLNARTAVTGNMIALIFAISIPFVWNKDRILSVIIIMVAVLSIFSGVRRQIVISLVVLGLSFLVSILKDKTQTILKYTLSAIFICTIVLLVYPLAENFLHENSPDLYRRLILKSEMLFDNEVSESDQFRYNKLSGFTDNLENDMFPKGFVTKRSTDNNIYIDFPIYEVSYMLGLPLCILLIVIFINRIIYHMKSFFVFGIRESTLCLIWILTIMLLIFLEGTFLNYPFATLFTGYALARIFSTKNLII